MKDNQSQLREIEEIIGHDRGGCCIDPCSKYDPNDVHSIRIIEERKCDCGTDKKVDQINSLIEKQVKEERINHTEEIVRVLDELEINQPDYAKENNWRNWKYIRNSIRDKYVLSIQEEKK